MAPNPSKIKVLRQTLAKRESELYTSANKDQVRAQIAAVKALLADEMTK